MAQVRLDVYPDGGRARLRLWARQTVDGRKQLGRNWFDALLPDQAVAILETAGASADEARGSSKPDRRSDRRHRCPRA